MKKRVSQPPSLPAGYVTSRYREPEWAKLESVATRWRVGSTPSCQAFSVPDSKSSAKTVSTVDCATSAKGRSGSRARSCGVQPMRRAKLWLGLLGKPLWVVADGAYAKATFLKPLIGW